LEVRDAVVATRAALGHRGAAVDVNELGVRARAPPRRRIAGPDRGRELGPQRGIAQLGAGVPVGGEAALRGRIALRHDHAAPSTDAKGPTGTDRGGDAGAADAAVATVGPVAAVPRPVAAVAVATVAVAAVARSGVAVATVARSGVAVATVAPDGHVPVRADGHVAAGVRVAARGGGGR